MRAWYNDVLYSSILSKATMSSRAFEVGCPVLQYESETRVTSTIHPSIVVQDNLRSGPDASERGRPRATHAPAHRRQSWHTDIIALLAPPCLPPPPSLRATLTPLRNGDARRTAPGVLVAPGVYKGAQLDIPSTNQRAYPSLTIRYLGSRVARWPRELKNVRLGDDIADGPELSA